MPRLQRHLSAAMWEKYCETLLCNRYHLTGNALKNSTSITIPTEKGTTEACCHSLIPQLFPPAGEESQAQRTSQMVQGRTAQRDRMETRIYLVQG